MSELTVQIELSEAAHALMKKMAAFPERRMQAIARAMDMANQVTATRYIQAHRIVSQKGPFPVIEGKLGRVHGGLQGSVRPSRATINGNRVMSAIGSNVKYARIHEYGSGNLTRTTKPGKVRLRLDRRGGLVRQLGHPNLAKFAKKSGKLAKEVSYQGGKTYLINMPARAPFGHGIADAIAAGEYRKAIEAELQKEWEAGN